MELHTLLFFLLMIPVSRASISTRTCTKPSSTQLNMKARDEDDIDTQDFVFERILAAEHEAIDPSLPKSIEALKERGAHRCWHKHSTFLEHLVGVHNILRLWGESETIGRVGLFHSAYSNSYVNLALFDPESEREIMKDLIGEEAEELVYLFCIIDRQQVVVNTLLKDGFIPKEGLEVPHLRHPEQKVFLSAETLRMLVVFTMADICDQYFGWQDALFGGGGSQGSMIIPGQDFADRHESTAIWPGLSKPGLWMSYVSQLAKVATTYQGEKDLTAPPVFEYGTRMLSLEDDAAARDLYWKVVTEEVSDEEIVSTLETCIEKNPFAFEPLVMLAQKYLHKGDFDGAIQTTDQALQLQSQWGTAWDKRLSFGAWVAWTRVLHQRALERLPWPTNSWEVNNFGLVK